MTLDEAIELIKPGLTNPHVNDVSGVSITVDWGEGRIATANYEKPGASPSLIGAIMAGVISHTKRLGIEFYEASPGEKGDDNG